MYLPGFFHITPCLLREGITVDSLPGFYWLKGEKLNMYQNNSNNVPEYNSYKNKNFNAKANIEFEITFYTIHEQNI